MHIWIFLVWKFSLPQCFWISSAIRDKSRNSRLSLNAKTGTHTRKCSKQSDNLILSENETWTCNWLIQVLNPSSPSRSTVSLFPMDIRENWKHEGSDVSQDRCTPLCKGSGALNWRNRTRILEGRFGQGGDVSALQWGARDEVWWRSGCPGLVVGLLPLLLGCGCCFFYPTFQPVLPGVENWFAI